MKHLLNNMSEEEKNAIREQHAGGMKVMTENFNKLLNSKLGDSKPLISEQAVSDPEMGNEYPEMGKMISYVMQQWKKENLEPEVDQNSAFTTVKNTNSTEIKFNTGAGQDHKIHYEKLLGINPSPLPIKTTTFDQFKKWFDANNNYNPLSGFAAVKSPYNPLTGTKNK